AATKAGSRSRSASSGVRPIVPSSGRSLNTLHVRPFSSSSARSRCPRSARRRRATQRTQPSGPRDFPTDHGIETLVRIAFVGLPLAGLLVARDGHEIVWAGICRRDAIGTRRLRALLGENRVVVVPDLSRNANVIRAAKPDLVVSWFWTKNIPRSVREAASLG